MHSIYKQGNLPYLSVKCCPKCEQLLPLDSESCSNCGYNFTFKALIQPTVKEVKVEQPIQKEVVTYQSEEPKVEEKVEVKPVEKKVEKCVFCDNCGAKIIGSQRYCGGCGAKVSKRVCPSCTQIVDSNLIFCPLCGERLQESNTNITPVETPVSNQVQQQPYNSQPIHIFLNSNNGQTTVKEPTEEQTASEETAEKIVNEPSKIVSVEEEKQDILPVVTEEESETKEEHEEDLSKPLINMGRKRLFLIIQLMLIAVIAVIMIMVPILTKETLVNALIPCVKGTSTETIVTGKDMFSYVLEIIENKSVLLNSSSVIYPHIINENNEAIFTNMPFVKFAFNLIGGDASILNVTVAMVVVVVSYVLLTIALLISFLSGFFGLFIKKPYRGKTLGFVLFALVFDALLIYSSTFFEAFKGYDSWLLYALALVFFVWFIVKLVFTKEAKNYKKVKAIEKEISKSE